VAAEFARSKDQLDLVIKDLEKMNKDLKLIDLGGFILAPIAFRVGTLSKPYFGPRL